MYLYSKHIGDTNVDIILYICVLTLFGYPHGASSNRNSILINYMTQLFLHHLIGSHSCTSNRKDEQRYDSFRGKRSCTKENHPLVPIPIQPLCPLHWSDDGHLFQSPEQASSVCARASPCMQPRNQKRRGRANTSEEEEQLDSKQMDTGFTCACTDPLE